MAWTVADIPDLAGRTAVVTGGNGGLGLETVAALAGAGALVVMAARNPEKTEDARHEVLDRHPDASIAVQSLDLGSLASIREAAGRVRAEHPAIDILVNNAGVMGIPEQRTEDGFEMQLGVNHLGHFALTAGLMPALVRSEAARVVTVTSMARLFCRSLDPANPHMRGNYRAWGAYEHSKLANYHFALGLQERLEAAGVPVASYAAHPGLSNTDLQAHSVRETGGGASQRFWRFLAARFGMDPAHGALPQLRAATDPAAKGGELYGPRFFFTGPAVRLPVLRRIGLSGATRSLWAVSQQETGIALDVDTIRREAAA